MKIGTMIEMLIETLRVEEHRVRTELLHDEGATDAEHEVNDAYGDGIAFARKAIGDDTEHRYTGAGFVWHSWSTASAAAVTPYTRNEQTLMDALNHVMNALSANAAPDLRAAALAHGNAALAAVR